MSLATAEWFSTRVDGMITISQPIEKLKAMINLFKKTNDQSIQLKVQLSYAKNLKQAKEMVLNQSKSCILPNDVISDLKTVTQMELAGTFIKNTNLKEYIIISNELNHIKNCLLDYLDLGFSTINLHNVNQLQEDFIKDFVRKILPEFGM